MRYSFRRVRSGPLHLQGRTFARRTFKSCSRACLAKALLLAASSIVGACSREGAEVRCPPGPLPVQVGDTLWVVPRELNVSLPQEAYVWSATSGICPPPGRQQILAGSITIRGVAGQPEGGLPPGVRLTIHASRNPSADIARMGAFVEREGGGARTRGPSGEDRSFRVVRAPSGANTFQKIVCPPHRDVAGAAAKASNPCHAYATLSAGSWLDVSFDESAWPLAQAEALHHRTSQFLSTLRAES